jgi:hypothetical protein
MTIDRQSDARNWLVSPYCYRFCYRTRQYKVGWDITATAVESTFRAENTDWGVLGATVQDGEHG